jgi:retron-type reverse transcriptase
VSRIFDEKRLTGAVCLDVAKAFDTVWVDGLLYKLTTLNFPYLVKNISSYLNGRTFEASFQTATSTSHSLHAGVAQGGIISPVLFSLHVNDMHSPSRHVELALYADDTAIIDTSRQPTLLVKYLETYLSDLEQWLSEWRIAINVSKSSTMLFIKAQRIQQPRPVKTLRGANPMGQRSPLPWGNA